MEGMLNSIKAAVDAKIWQPALALSLCLPDILGQIEYPELAGPGHVGRRYTAWFDAWVVPFLFSGEQAHHAGVMDGDDAFAFRCSYLHVGDNTVKKSQWLMIHPTPGNLAHFSREEALGVKTVLHVGTEPFCLAICDAARTWGEDLLQRRPEAACEIYRLLHIQPDVASVDYTITAGQFTVRSIRTFR